MHEDQRLVWFTVELSGIYYGLDLNYTIVT